MIRPGRDRAVVYLNANGGDSNEHRSRLFKAELQAFTDEIVLEIQMSHFPPGTRKGNAIEHAL
jgi:hypothetical protein